MRHSEVFLFLTLLLASFVWSQSPRYEVMLNRPDIVGLTGGGNTKLDGIPTTGLSVGTIVLVYDESSGETRIYRLSDTSGVVSDSIPIVIVPDDYNATTNHKVWKLSISSDADETGSSDTISSASGDTTDTIVVAAQLKVYGELIADSIQAVGNTILVNDNILISGGDRYYGRDATGADSFWIYDDGDTTRFDSDNPIKVGHSSLIVDTSGYITMSKGIIVGTDTVIVSGGDISTDTVFSGKKDIVTDTVVAYDNFKVYGELIADSIQSAGDSIYIDKPFHSVGFNNVGTATITGLATVYGGINITAGGLNIGAGGLTINAGGASITGAVNVTGSETVSNALYVDTIDVESYDTVVVNDDLKVVGDLIVTGSITGSQEDATDTIWANFSAGKSHTTDTVVAYDNLKVYGELIADSIQAAGGTVEIDADMTVHGGLDVDNDLNVTGDISGSNGYFDYIDNSGNLDVGGNLSVTGDLDVSGYLNVTGDISGDNGNFGSNLDVGGVLTVLGDISGANGDFSGDLDVGGDLTVTGEVSGGLDVNGDLTVMGDISGNNGDFSGYLDVGGALTVTDDISGDNGDFSGNLNVGGDLDVTGNVSAGDISADSIYANSGIVATNNLDVGMDGHFGGNVTIDGNLTVTGDITNSNLAIDTLYRGSKGTVTDTLVMYDNVKVYGELIADSIQAVGNTILVTDNILVSGGNRYYGRDATGADSFSIYDDGDTTRFDSDNPIKIGHGSVVISDNSTYISGNAFVGDTLIIGDVKEDNTTDSVLVLSSDGRVSVTSKSSFSGGTGNCIQNQYSSAQNANAWVSGRLAAAILRAVPDQPDTFTPQAGMIRTYGSGSSFGAYIYDGSCWRKWFPSIDTSGCYGGTLSVDAGDDTTIYSGQSVSLTADVSGGWSPYDYDWDNDGTGDWDDPQTIDVSPTDTTVYHIRVRDVTNAIASDSVTINVIYCCAHAVGGTSDDYGYSIVETYDGGLVVVGYTESFGAGDYDLFLVKFNSSGSLQWAKAVGGTNYDCGYSVIQTSDSGFVVTGYTYSFGAGVSDLFLVKFNSSGSLQWAKAVGGTSYDIGQSVIQTSDSGFVVAGYTYSFGAGGSDLFLLKFNSSGSLQWAKAVGGTDYDYGYSVIQTSDSGFVVAGYTRSFGAGGNDLFIVKFNSSGSLQWAKAVGGAHSDGGKSVVQDSDSGFVVAGGTESYGSGGRDLFLLKFNSSGSLQWAKAIGGTSDDYALSLVQTSDSELVVTGHTGSYGAGGDDLFLAGFDSSGSLQWAKAVGGTSDDYGESVVQSSDSGFVVAGHTQSFGAGNDDLFLVKFGSDGSCCIGTSVTPTVTTVSPTVNSPSPSVATPTPTVTTVSPTVTNVSPTETDCCP